MLSNVQSLGYRLRRGLWSFERWQLSRKRLAVLFLVAGVASSVGLKALLATSGQMLLWTCLLLVAAWLLRPYGQLFFGPVLFYDLVRSSRRGEQVGHRCVYAILLVCVLAAVYWSWFPGQGLEHLLRSKSMSIAERARFAGSFFTSFMTAQIVVVFFITPLYTANAIAEQKERRTLDFLLITDLTNREIILGMLGARLAKLLLLLMTGLPVLSLLEFLGGVDPGRVIAGFVATCVLMVSLGSVSILASVYARTALGAVINSYLGALIIFGCSVAVLSITEPVAQIIVHFNLFAGSAWGNIQSATNLIALMVLAFALGPVTILLTILCCRTAVAQLRRVAMAQAGGTGGTGGLRVTAPTPVAPIRRNPKSSGMGGGWGPYPVAPDSDPNFICWQGLESRPQSTRPRVGTDALLWKEIYAENTLGLAGPRQLHPGAMLALMGLLIFIIACFNSPQTRGSVGEYIQGWVLRLEIMLSFVLLLVVGLSASRRLSRERERRTLDNLLTLPVSTDAILFAKWLGSILSVSTFWWLLGPIWALGVVTGALSILAVPFLAAAIMVYAGFVASLGLWFSTVSRSTMRASLFTLLVALIFLAVPGALTTAGSPSFNPIAEHPFWVWRSLLMEYGLSPPATLWVLTFRSADLLKEGDQLFPLARIVAAVAGLHFYMAATAVLWLLTRARVRNS